MAVTQLKLGFAHAVRGTKSMSHRKSRYSSLRNQQSYDSGYSLGMKAKVDPLYKPGMTAKVYSDAVARAEYRQSEYYKRGYNDASIGKEVSISILWNDYMKHIYTVGHNDGKLVYNNPKPAVNAPTTLTNVDNLNLHKSGWESAQHGGYFVKTANEEWKRGYRNYVIHSNAYKPLEELIRYRKSLFEKMAMTYDKTVIETTYVVINILNNIIETKEKGKEMATKATVTNKSSDKTLKAVVRTPKTKPAPKAAGQVVINAELPNIKRPLMVSDMKYGQTFIREGELCMRVLNVCNNNQRGQASTDQELWICSLSKHKVWLATNTPVQLVDLEINVVAQQQ